MDPDPNGSVMIWLSWIRIRLGNADQDPGARKFPFFKDKPDLKPLCTFIFYYLLEVYFSYQDSTFSDGKV
jgi:hypothetical protein